MAKYKWLKIKRIARRQKVFTVQANVQKRKGLVLTN
jgi:hypothetical protein